MFKFALGTLAILGLLTFTSPPVSGEGPQYQIAELDSVEVDAFMAERFQQRENFKEKGNSGRYLKYHNFDL